MRHLPLLLLLLSSALAAEPAYPLWDGHESVEYYAKRVNLPQTKTLDLGGGVKMELVLIPAGEFVMGTPQPVPVDEDKFRKQVVMGQALLAMSCGVLLALLGAVAVKAIRQRRRPKFSLARLLAMTMVAGVGVWGGVRWWQAVRGCETALLEHRDAMGRYNAAYYTEKPAHHVTLTTPFYLGKYPVTKEQYQQASGKSANVAGSDFPVVNISWKEANDACAKLSAPDSLIRLPTDAEWEFACRAGTRSDFYTGDSYTDLARAGWYSGNSESSTHAIGKKEANAFGLYDMHGNVWQWCQDWYADHSEIAAFDPHGPDKGTNRILRGGSWTYDAKYCRSAYRMWYDPNGHFSDIGFRIAANVPHRTP